MNEAVFHAGARRPDAGRYDVDVIILALDRVEPTLEAIRSASSQIGVTKHVFVLDQGSQPVALGRLATEVDGRTDVTLLRSAHNLGVAGGRNLVSAQGHGRIIVALDNDAEFAAPDTLVRMVAALDTDTRLAAIGCRIVTHADGRDDLSSWGYPASLLPQAGGIFASVTFVGAGHALRRLAWEESGGYDEALFFCWEEYDFCLRAIARNWRVRYCGDLVIRHKVSGEQRVSWSGNRWFYFVRNRLYIERKQGRSWFGLMPRTLGYVLKGARNRQGSQTMRAILAARQMRPNETVRMPPTGRIYLAVNDRAHRGSCLTRIRREVLMRLGPPIDAGATAE